MRSASWLHAFWREPLLHFLLLGAGLFVLYGWVGGASSLSTRVIDIDRGRVEHLAAGFAALNQRAPTSEELRELIDDAVKEEIFYREALAQGLDRDDVIVRRRLRQKLEFVSEDVAPVPEPGDSQLGEWLRAHPASFAISPRYSFEQVYLDASSRGGSLAADAQSLLLRLRAGEAGVQGDPLLLARDWRDVPGEEVGARFGARFTTALDGLAPGQWQGPVASGLGLHLVRLARRDTARVPALAEVRPQVRTAWMHAQREAANARFYAGLRQRYEIRIDMPAQPATVVPAGIAKLQP